MAQFVTFSGESSEILVKSGTTEINVQTDLYSPWKEWVSESDNAKYLHAFRTVGGDPTSAGQYSPRYFFLMNGWRVVVDGNLTSSVDFAINLYVDEGGSPFTILNGANVSNLRSDVGVVESELQDTLDYAGVIWYDAIDGISGSTHPTGTAAYPVNNSSDLQLLMDTYDINEVLLNSNIVVTQDFNNVLWRTNTGAQFFNPNGFSLDECFFYRMQVTGDYSESNVVFQDCSLIDVSDVYGIANNCNLSGTLRVTSGQSMVLSHCGSSVPGYGTPTVDMYSGYPTYVSFRAWSGGLTVINCDHSGDTATFEYVAGRCILTDTCTDGYISVRGVVDIVDGSSGTTIDSEAGWDPGVESNKLKEILGLAQSNYKISEQGYDANDNLTGATIYTYSTVEDLVSGSPVLHEYTMVASYDGSNNMIAYSVGKVT